MDNNQEIRSLINKLITKNGINSLLRISSNLTANSDTLVDFCLQIITINLQPGNQKNKKQKKIYIYSCTLGDFEFKYNGFIISRSLTDPEPKTGDIINIRKISVNSLNSKNKTSKLIIVKRYQYIKTSFTTVNESLIMVNSYEDLQLKKRNLKHENKEIKDYAKIQEKFNEENNLSQLISKNNNFPETSNNITQNNIIPIDNINNNSENNNIIDMNQVLKLSQISTFTKNICLYIKVTRKNTIRDFHNKITNKQCKLLSLEIMDFTGFIMNAALFDNTIYKLGPLFEEGEIYYIKGGYAKFNDKRFSNVKSDYRLVFNYNTLVIKINKKDDKLFNNTEKTDLIIGNNNSFIKFAELIHVKKNKTINCIGYVIQIYPIQTKSSRIGEVIMRKIILGDSTGYKCQVTLWRDFTELNINIGDIMLLKFVRVGSYNNNACLSTIDESMIIINPEEKINEIEDLKNYISSVDFNDETFKYLNNTNNNINNQLISNQNEKFSSNNLCYIRDILKNVDGKNNYSKNFIIKATILEFEHNDKNFYFGCQNKMCMKKLINKEGEWYCPSCEKNYDEPAYYYTLSLRVIDLTGEHSINLFGSTVNKLFGVDGQTYGKAVLNNDHKLLQEISEKIEYKKYYFYGKASLITFNNRIKKQLFAHNIEKEDIKVENVKIIQEIKDYLNIN